MSKKPNPFQEEINNLTAKVDSYIKQPEQKFNKVRKETERQFSELNKKQKRMGEIFAPKKNHKFDHEIELELKEMAKDLGIDLNAKKPKTLDDIAIEKLEKEIERESKHSGINQHNPNEAQSSSASINKRESANIHKNINTTTKKLTETTPNHKKENGPFEAANPNKIAQNLDGNQAKEKQRGSSKLMSGIALGAEKFYSGLKSGISTTIDKIKELGTKFTDSIKSWVSKPQKEQKVPITPSIGGARADINEVKKPSDKNLSNENSSEKLKEAVKNLRWKYVKIHFNGKGKEDQKTIFDKWNKNKNVEKMTPQECAKECKRTKEALVKEVVKGVKKNLETYNNKHSKVVPVVNKGVSNSSVGRGS